MSKKPWKKLPCEHRAALLAMSNAALKVWMAHYLRSDREDKVEIANSQIMRECDLGLSSVKESKRWLKGNGWLKVDKSAYKDELGRWVSPELVATFPGLESDPNTAVPGLESNPDPRVEIQPRSRVEKPAAVFSTLPVAPLFSASPQTLPVDSGEKHSTKTVDETATAVAQGAAAAAARSTDLSLTDDETGLLEYWYQTRMNRGLSDMDSFRIQNDLPFVQELISTVNGNSRSLLEFVFTDPGEGDWAGWDKKSPNLPALLKHVRKGDILAQFSAYREEHPYGASPISGIPPSRWEGMCRAPGCERPWTEDDGVLKLCVVCAGLKEAPPKGGEVPFCHMCGQPYQLSYGFPPRWEKTCWCGKGINDDDEVVIRDINVETDEL
jgi:hypothetical protein